MAGESERSKDELIKAQNEVIGILFEIIKRLQTNNDLDGEYLNLALRKSQKKTIDEKKIRSNSQGKKRKWQNYKSALS